MQIKVSAVIPCLNESETIERAIHEAQEGLRHLAVPTEVVVADNGSTDGSQELSEKAGARVVHVPVRGYGMALHHGFLGAKGEILVMGDADLSYPFLEIPNLVKPILENKYDFVLGNRLNNQMEPNAMPTLNRFMGTPVLSFIIRTLFRFPITDCNSGMRAFRKKDYEKWNMQCPGMEYASEMIVAAASQSGLRYMEIDIPFRKDKRSRPPHLKRWRDGWRHLRFILGSSSSWIVINAPLVFSLVLILVSLLLSFGEHFGSGKVRYHTAFALLSLSMILNTFAASQIYVRALRVQAGSLKSRGIDFLNTFSSTGAPFYYSGILFTLALAEAGYLFYSWASSGFGDLAATGSMIRIVLFASLGAQLFTLDFTLGLLKLIKSNS